MPKNERNGGTKRKAKAQIATVSHAAATESAQRVQTPSGVGSSQKVAAVSGPRCSR